MLLKFHKILLFFLLIINACLALYLLLSFLIIFTWMCNHFHFVKSTCIRIFFNIGLSVTKFLRSVRPKLSLLYLHFEMHFHHAYNFRWIIISSELTESIFYLLVFIIIDNSLFNQNFIPSNICFIFSSAIKIFPLYFELSKFTTMSLEMSFRSYLESKDRNHS